MDNNQKIFEKARYLGINVDGDTAEEKLQNIANQIGLPNFNSSEELSSKLDEAYYDKLQERDLQNQKEPVQQKNPEQIHPKQSIQRKNNDLSKTNKDNKNNLSNSSQSNFRRNINQYRNSPNNDDKLKNKLEQSKRLFHQKTNTTKLLGNNQENQDIIKNDNSKKGLQSLGIPSFLSNMKGKKISESNGGKINLDYAKIAAKLPMIGVGAVAIVLSFLIFIVVGSTTLEDDESEVNTSQNVKEYVTGSVTDEQLTDELVYLNICRSNGDKTIEISECLNSPAGKYFIHLKELYNDYSKYSDRNGNPLELNVGLILETVSYDITDRDLFTEENLENILAKLDELAEAQVEHYQEIGDLYTSSETLNDEVVLGSKGESSYYRISSNKFISYLLYGKVHENYQGKIKKYNVDIHPDSESDYIPAGRKYNGIEEEKMSTTYSGNIKDGYLYINFLYNRNLNEDEIKKNNEEILKEIYERANQTYSGGISSSGLVCPGIMVTGDNAGVYSLEDYIAGVIQKENDWYQGDNIENMKAQAVAARTYALKITANCTLPIENSDSTQTFNPNPGAKAKQAALETANQVLVNESGDYISAEYDALAVKEVTSDYYILKQANLEIPVSWIEANISSSDLEYYENHHHGRGMSQWGSRYLQTIGYTYNQILNTFYTSGEIATLGNSVVADIPNNVNDLKDRYYFNFDIDIYRGNTLFGQCVWYAKHRAMEILASSDLNEDSKQILINSIRNVSGNGKDWYNGPSSTYFKKTTNINEPKAGSIVSWAWTQDKCRSFYDGHACDAAHPNYGHVAIIEAVKTNSSGETIVTMTEGWRAKENGVSGWYITDDLWSVVKMQKVDITLAKLQSYGIFNGYVYLY